MASVDFWTKVIQIEECEEVIGHLAPELVECCRFTEEDEMQVEETGDNDINVF